MTTVSATRSGLRRGLMGAMLAVALVCAGVTLDFSAPAAAQAGPAKPTNIILITSDDQSMASFTQRAMPRTFRLRDHGTNFSESIAVPPLCCPARAGWITGQYPHHHGVFKNKPGYSDLREPENVLPRWLDRAGYRTGFFGKYLNGTAAALGASPAPGWDRWFGLAGPVDYFHQRISVDGNERRFDRYLTPLLSDRATDFVRDSDRARKPFFLWLSHLAPHGQDGTSSARCPSPAPPVRSSAYRPFADAPLPKSPNFDERDVSDKPKSVRRLPRLSDEDVDELRQRHRCTLAAMSVVDDGVGQILAAVKKAGIMDETAIVFTDDNGYMAGEHRIQRGKSNIYEESLRVPMVAHLPRSALGRRPVANVGEPVGGIDLAPTFLELAGGANPCAAAGDCRTMDGRSLADLAAGRNGSWPEDRGLLIEVGGSCHQRAIRTKRFLYATSPDACNPRNLELYDLRRDPFELENLGRSRPDVHEDLDGRLESLLGCAGVAGRDSPPPGGASYCE